METIKVMIRKIVVKTSEILGVKDFDEQMELCLKTAPKSYAIMDQSKLTLRFSTLKVEFYRGLQRNLKK